MKHHFQRDAIESATIYTDQELKKLGFNVEPLQVKAALWASGASHAEISIGAMPRGYHAATVERKRSGKPEDEIKM